MKYSLIILIALIILVNLINLMLTGPNNLSRESLTNSLLLYPSHQKRCLVCFAFLLKRVLSVWLPLQPFIMIRIKSDTFLANLLI